MKTYPMQVDGSTGSSQLLAPLHTVSNGQAVSNNLVALGADVAWTGRGPDSSLLTCGLEYKTVEDFIESTYTGRLGGHQIPTMVEHYDIRYLLIEGLFRPDKRGLTEVMNESGQWRQYWRGKAGTVPYSYIRKFLQSAAQQAGFTILHTASFTDTVTTIFLTWEWWQRVYESHDSINTIYVRELPRVHFQRPNTVAIVAASIPGIGSTLAHRAGKHFHTVQAMVNADAAEWAKIQGVGQQLAGRIPKLLQTFGGVK